MEIQCLADLHWDAYKFALIWWVVFYAGFSQTWYYLTLKILILILKIVLWWWTSPSGSWYWFPPVACVMVTWMHLSKASWRPLDSSCAWLWRPHVLRLSSFHSHVSKHPACAAFWVWCPARQVQRERFLYFPALGKVWTGPDMCPTPHKQTEAGVRLLDTQRLLLARWFLHKDDPGEPELPLFLPSPHPENTLRPHLLPADFLHLTLARVIF